MGGARSEGQGGPQARARKRALSLTAVSAPACSNRSKKAILALDRQHGIYRDPIPLKIRTSLTAIGVALPDARPNYGRCDLRLASGGPWIKAPSYCCKWAFRTAMPV
jgi:hypothetical protein